MSTATVTGPLPVTLAPAQDGEDARPATPRPSGRAGLAALAGLVINFVLPLLAYELLRPHVASSAMALALAGAIPVAYTLAMLAATRRLSALGGTDADHQHLRRPAAPGRPADLRAGRRRPVPLPPPPGNPPARRAHRRAIRSLEHWPVAHDRLIAHSGRIPR